MKKQIIRSIALLILASVVISGCSVEYRQRHMRNDKQHERGDHDRDHDHDRDNNQ